MQEFVNDIPKVLFGVAAGVMIVLGFGDCGLVCHFAPKQQQWRPASVIDSSPVGGNESPEAGEECAPEDGGLIDL